MTTKLQCPAEFIAAHKLARELGGEAKRSFHRCLRSLNQIKRNYDATLHIFKDFPTHSFGFAFTNAKGERTGLDGAMILHGFEQTFAVELVSKAGPHWSIHT